jgi:hypothetical protein
MALFPSARPGIRVRVLPRFPAKVIQGAGIGATVANGTMTLGLNYPALTANAGVPDPSRFQAAIYNRDTLAYENIRLDQFPVPTETAVRTPRGDAAYTILNTDRFVALTASLTAPRTWSLPAANSVPAGRLLVIQDEAGGLSATNALTLTPTGTDTINGAASFVLNMPYAGIAFRSNGTSEWTIALSPAAHSVLAATSIRGNANATAGPGQDLTAAQGRTVLGLGGAATLNVGTTTGTVAAGDDARINGAVRYDTAQALTAGQQAQARENIGTMGANRTLNGDFRINERGYVSGTALAAGAYGHDQWKAGASGGTYTFTQLKASTVITITAGSLIQPIEDVMMDVGGTWVLSWQGTGTGRVGVNGAAAAGTYAASPIIVTGVTAGQQANLEFTGGTVDRVQFEPTDLASPKATPFTRRPYLQELWLCQRYWERVCVSTAQVAAAAAGNIMGMANLVPKRITNPAVTRLTDSFLFGSVGTTGATTYLVNSMTIAAYRAVSGAAGQQQFSELVAVSAVL